MVLSQGTLVIVMGEQINTRGTTLQAIMSSTAFGLGVRDVRTGRPARAAYTDWGTNFQWDYERGRAWATVAPRCMPLKIAGELNPAALRLGTQSGVII
jgi:hypothetical protein